MIKTIEIPYHYKCYPWQEEAEMAFMDGYELWLNYHRRGGKDLFCFADILVPYAIEYPGTYHYLWPTLKQGRDSIWEGKDEKGNDILDYYVPPDLVEKVDNADMRLVLKTDSGKTSVIQIFGTNKGQYESLRGKPANGAVFSEFAYQDPRGYDVVSPMLKKTKGFRVVNSTPNGHNHYYNMFNAAIKSPRCFTDTKTVLDTYDHNGNPLITQEDIEDERQRDQKSEDTIQQEYYCSFNQGIEGTYLGRQLQQARNEGRICRVPYDEAASVYTFWDLGVADFTSIWFVQLIGKAVHVIDFYEASNYSFVHYARILREKGYHYATHFAPHDVKAREQGSLSDKEERAISRLEKAEYVGIEFEPLPRDTFQNGIDNAKTIMSRCYFDEVKCALGLRHLEQWGRQFNEKFQFYTDFERRDPHTHAGAAFRYLATGISDMTHSAGAGKHSQLDRYYEYMANMRRNKYTGI
ncbi:MAG: terminase large subunit domain-containing protein [Eubacteriales bacterium]